jgi:hypothetical protein
MAIADAASEPRVHYRHGLRGWLEVVQRRGELPPVNDVHWDLEMGAVTRMPTEKSSRTAPGNLFDEIPGYAKGLRTLYGRFTHQASDATMKDAEYLAVTKKLDVNPVSGAEIDKLFAELYSTPKVVLARAGRAAPAK